MNLCNSKTSIIRTNFQVPTARFSLQFELLKCKLAIITFEWFFEILFFFRMFWFFAKTSFEWVSLNFDELFDWKMAKRLHKEHKLEIKYKALLELEKGKSNWEVAKSFGVPAKTLSTWKKSKDKVFEAFQKGSATTKGIKVGTYDQVNKAVLKRFARLRSENVPVSGVLIKEKALYFAKELNFEKFQASDGWLDKWKKRLVLIFYFRSIFKYITITT